MDARTKCGTAGLVNDPLLLTQLSQLHGQEFWTGHGIFIQLTTWMEIIGKSTYITQLYKTRRH